MNENYMCVIGAMADAFYQPGVRPKSFQADLLHDGAWVAQNPHVPFVWMIREHGTQICREASYLEDCLHSFRDDDFRLYWVNGTNGVICAPIDETCALERLRTWIRVTD